MTDHRPPTRRGSRPADATDQQLPPGVRRKRSGVLEVRYRPHPGAKEAYAYFETVTAAVAFQREVAAAKAQHGRYDGDRLVDGGTVGQAADRYLARARGLDDSTRYQYELVISNWVKPLLGGLPARAVERDDVERFVDALDGCPALSAASVHRYFGVLRAILVDLHLEGTLTGRPWCRVELPEVEDDERVRPLTHTEVAALAEAIGRRYRALVYVLTYGQLRPGEAYGIRRRQLGPGCATITIDQQRKRNARTGRTVTTRRLKTKASKRTVVLPATVAAILRRHLEEWRSSEAEGDVDPDAFVFVTPARRPISPEVFRGHAFAAAVRKAGLGEEVLGFKITPRLLRKTGGSLATDANVPLTATQQQMGHALLTTTANVYAKPILGAQERAAESVERAMAAELAALNIPGLGFEAPAAETATGELRALREQVAALLRRLDEDLGDDPPALTVVG